MYMYMYMGNMHNIHVCISTHCLHSCTVLADVQVYTCRCTCILLTATCVAACTHNAVVKCMHTVHNHVQSICISNSNINTQWAALALYTAIDHSPRHPVLHNSSQLYNLHVHVPVK